MTLPDRIAPRKPGRLGLYAPFALVLALALAWSAFWLSLRDETLNRMDLARASLRSEGKSLDWASRSVSGYPFRLDVAVEDLRFGDSSGWALTVPSLKAEAPAWAPDRWVALAPDGVVVSRRAGGDVAVKARGLRASFSEAGAHPPRVSVEGMDLTFTPAPGAEPFFLSAAGEFHLHTLAGPADQGAFRVELDGARASLTGLMGRIAQNRPVNLLLDAIYSRAASLSGRDWRGAVDAWRRAGGALEVRSLKLQAGDALLEAHGGGLTVGEDGRLRGSLTANLRQAPRALAAMSQTGAIAPEAAGTAATVVGARSQGPLARVTLVFQAGQTTLGPAAIAPAPKVY